MSIVDAGVLLGQNARDGGLRKERTWARVLRPPAAAPACYPLVATYVPTSCCHPSRCPPPSLHRRSWPRLPCRRRQPAPRRCRPAPRHAWGAAGLGSAHASEVRAQRASRGPSQRRSCPHPPPARQTKKNKPGVNIHPAAPPYPPAPAGAQGSYLHAPKPQVADAAEAGSERLIRVGVVVVIVLVGMGV